MRSIQCVITRSSNAAFNPSRYECPFDVRLVLSGTVILTFSQAAKVTKSGHHLFHDRASKGYGSIPGLTSQTYLHACLQRLNTMQISL